MASGTGLKAHLEVDGPVVVGLAALAVLTIENRGAAPALVSARLNLMEGDVALTVADPSGAVREIRGWQADTGLHRVDLPPGHSLTGVVNLLDAPDGPVFPAPGDYRLGARYSPGPAVDPVEAPAVSVTVAAPRTEDERALAALLADPAVRRALVLGDREAAPEKLKEIASRFPATLEARLARLVSGAGDASADEDPFATAHSILALTNPYSRTGERLAAGFAAGDSADDRAARLARLEPVPIAP